MSERACCHQKRPAVPGDTRGTAGVLHFSEHGPLGPPGRSRLWVRTRRSGQPLPSAGPRASRRKFFLMSGENRRCPSPGPLPPVLPLQAQLPPPLPARRGLRRDHPGVRSLSFAGAFRVPLPALPRQAQPRAHHTRCRCRPPARSRGGPVPSRAFAIIAARRRPGVTRVPGTCQHGGGGGRRRGPGPGPR